MVPNFDLLDTFFCFSSNFIYFARLSSNFMIHQELNTSTNFNYTKLVKITIN